LLDELLLLLLLDRDDELLDRDELDELLDRDELLDDELDRDEEDELEDRDDELELLDEEKLDDDALDDELDADEELADELLETAELDENPIGVGSAGLPPQAAIKPEAARVAPPDSSSRNSRRAVRIFSSVSSPAGRVRSLLIRSPLPDGASLAMPARLPRNTTRSAVSRRRP
jgi:hypothetical protein